MTIAIGLADPGRVRSDSGISDWVPCFARQGVQDGKIIATWGLCWAFSRCWLFFEIEQGVGGVARLVVNEARKCLRQASQLGESEVWVQRDAAHKDSGRLLRLVGFEFVALEDEIEVWKWQACKSCQQ